MPPSQRPHPLRRISTGSLSSLARSQDATSCSSPSGLDFLAPAMMDLADEASSLAINVDKLNEMHDALGTFNEAFAGYMYALKMNAFCVEWDEAPSVGMFERIAAAEEAARQAATSISHFLDPSDQYPSHAAGGSARSGGAATISDADMTYATVDTVDEPEPQTIRKSSMKQTGAAGRGGAGSGAGSAAGTTGIRKPAPAGPQAAAARRKRDLEVASYIEQLPLEYRGGDPNMRLGMEKVIKKLLVSPDGCLLQDMVVPLELPQVKVNKHLMALVGRKLVRKESKAGKACYYWGGV